MPRSRSPGLLLSALVLLACGSPPTSAGGEEEHPLRTEHLEYELRHTESGFEGEIAFAYTNRTGETVSLINCRGNVPPSLEKREGDGWVTAWTPVTLMCLSPPVVIEPDATFTDTLRIVAGRPSGDVRPRFQVAEVEGTYRLVWHWAVHDYDPDRQGFGDPLPLEERISNSFVLRIASSDG